jgi:hypothetical protein
MFVMTLGVTLGAIAAPQLLASVDDVRAGGAVRYVATRLEQARMEAIVRAADVGWQFVDGGNGYSYTIYLDGNRNGIRSRDIQRGIDLPIGAVERLSDQFAGVDFGVAPDLPAIEAGGTPPGTDPIKLGPGNVLTFTALGTSSSGSLYVRGRGGMQYVIRILGETGRVRILKFDARLNRWNLA